MENNRNMLDNHGCNFYDMKKGQYTQLGSIFFSDFYMDFW